MQPCSENAVESDAEKGYMHNAQCAMWVQMRAASYNFSTIAVSVHASQRAEEQKEQKKRCKVLGHPSPVRPKNPNPIRVRWNASTARSRGTRREIVLSTLPQI